jgi:hypothetical protein
MWKEAAAALKEVLSQHFLEGLRETTTTLRQDSRSLGRERIPGPAQYEAGVYLNY